MYLHSHRLLSRASPPPLKHAEATQFWKPEANEQQAIQEVKTEVSVEQEKKGFWNRHKRIILGIPGGLFVLAFIVSSAMLWFKVEEPKGVAYAGLLSLYMVSSAYLFFSFIKKRKLKKLIDYLAVGFILSSLSFGIFVSGQYELVGFIVLAITSLLSLTFFLIFKNSPRDIPIFTSSDGNRAPFSRSFSYRPVQVPILVYLFGALYLLAFFLPVYDGRLGFYAAERGFSTLYGFPYWPQYSILYSPVSVSDEFPSQSPKLAFR